MTATKSLLFDMGNVLVHIDERRRDTQLAAALGLDPSQLASVLKDLQWSYECGHTSTADFAAALLAAGTRRTSAAAVLAAFCDMFRPNPAMPPVLAALRAAGHRLVAVSNTNPTHVAHLTRHLDVLAPFHALVLSHEIKAMKPMPAFYAAALEAAQTPPASALFIDDLPANVEGARAAGFATYLYVPTPDGHAAFLAALGGFIA